MKSWMGATTVSLAASLALLAGLGCDDDDDAEVEAQEALLPDDFTFADIDTDDDGLVSLTEWQTMAGRWDVHRDGVITSDEYRLEDGFVLIDAITDLRLTAFEFNLAFDVWDANDDGFLEEDELGEGFL